jgi:tRNA (guanine37-N1)-methyltransferase
MGMDFVVLTIFPELFHPFFSYGIVGRARKSGKISATALDIRSFTKDRHKTTDDRPYGGGCGMVMKPEPLASAVTAARNKAEDARCVMLTPQGRPFDQEYAQELAREPGLILICGRYEGVDERICFNFVDDEASLGDFIMTGGEIGAMAVMDAVIRLIPGVLGGADSARDESFSSNLLEYAHYTRPSLFHGEKVPEVLLSGNHQRIAQWRFEASVIRTFLKRPDMLANRCLSEPEKRVLTEWCHRIEALLAVQSEPGSDPSSSKG